MCVHEPPRYEGARARREHTHMSDVPSCDLVATILNGGQRRRGERRAVGRNRGRVQRIDLSICPITANMLWVTLVGSGIRSPRGSAGRRHRLPAAESRHPSPLHPTRVAKTGNMETIPLISQGSKAIVAPFSSAPMVKSIYLHDEFLGPGGCQCTAFPLLWIRCEGSSASALTARAPSERLSSNSEFQRNKLNSNCSTTEGPADGLRATRVSNNGLGNVHITATRPLSAQTSSPLSAPTWVKPNSKRPAPTPIWSKTRSKVLLALSVALPAVADLARSVGDARIQPIFAPFFTPHCLGQQMCAPLGRTPIQDIQSTPPDAPNAFPRVGATPAPFFELLAPLPL